MIILHNHIQWFVSKPKAINTQGKLQNIFMQMKHLGDFGVCFHIVTITICSFLTALSILLCWRFGNHYKKFKFPLDTEMYELRRTYFRANTSWQSREKKNHEITLNFLKLPLVKTDKIEWQKYQMDYCAHEDNLLHRSEDMKSLRNQYFVLSNGLQNLILKKLIYFFCFVKFNSCKMKKIAYF